MSSYFDSVGHLRWMEEDNHQRDKPVVTNQNETSDLVERLRATSLICNEAADVIERLRAGYAQYPDCWMTFDCHGIPMLWITYEDAAKHCDDDEAPIPLFRKELP